MWHIILFDGTRNGYDDENPTNIRKIRDLADVPGQAVHYYEGVGNDEDDLIDKWLGGGLGVGIRDIRDAAYSMLQHEYEPGDKISMFAFSRGCIPGRMLCHLLAEDGVEVEFLGCFDTVVAFLPFGRFQQDPLFGDLHISPKVKQARHALACDEDRQAFAPRQMNKRDGVLEMWFRGNHADIGGGYEESWLSDITLNWMLSEAAWCTSLTFKPPPQGATPHKPHRERLPLLREPREPVVLVDDKPTDLMPRIAMSDVYIRAGG